MCVLCSNYNEAAIVAPAVFLFGVRKLKNVAFQKGQTSWNVLQRVQNTCFHFMGRTGPFRTDFRTSGAHQGLDRFIQMINLN